MAYSISKDYAFSASHRLDGLAEGHQCGRLHGHNYAVRVTLTGRVLDGTGMVLDYAQLAPVKDYLDQALDHRHLNDVLDDNPTAENLARYLHAKLRELVDVPYTVTCEVAVSETPKTWASYRDRP